VLILGECWLFNHLFLFLEIQLFTNLSSLKRISTYSLYLSLVLLMGIFSGCAGKDVDETASWSQSKLLSEAKSALKDNDYPNCVKYYEKLEARYPFGPLAEQSQINSAYCNWKRNDQELALASINRFIQLHPDHPDIDYAYYLKGLITFNDNLGFLAKFSGQDLSERDPKASKDAYEAFKVLTTRYPNSKYTPDALDRMRYIVNALAESDVNAARYYYRRGAYVATINRAQTALKDYDRAPAIEEALYLMVKSYDALGMKDLSTDTMRIFNANFPNSEIFKTGKRQAVTAQQTKWWQFWNSAN
jgi:outer membrane protein assembly factor BamD